MDASASSHQPTSGSDPDHNNSNDVTIATRNLYVSGIDAQVREAELLQLFLQYGEVESHKLMVNIKTGQSRGFGFIMYTRDEDARAAAVGLNGFKLYGQCLEIRSADVSTRTPPEPTPCVLIRNLPAAVANDIEAITGQHGTVVRTRTFIDDRGGGSSHENVVVLITMSSVTEAQSVARALNNTLQFASGTAAATGALQRPSGSVPRPRPLQAKVVGIGEEESIVKKLRPLYYNTPGSIAAPSPPPTAQRQAPPFNASLSSSFSFDTHTGTTAPAFMPTMSPAVAAASQALALALATPSLNNTAPYSGFLSGAAGFPSPHVAFDFAGQPVPLHLLAHMYHFHHHHHQPVPAGLAYQHMIHQQQRQLYQLPPRPPE